MSDYTSSSSSESITRKTSILPVDASKIGRISPVNNEHGLLEDVELDLKEEENGVRYLRLAAQELQNADIPVAFPTETVYGLGADATRGEAVRGIYAAKQRPSDNPLIVHFASLRQLKDLLKTGGGTGTIPSIYEPLIKKFWPGPLTIILPNPPNSPLAPEVTAGLSTFGARMPQNLLALVLIKLAGKPIAAPSANASTRPSPTAAEHVQEDLNGRINYIIDGGPCSVGVESTVVDGLSDPPAVLRPGGISIEQLRECPGWENVVVGYEDASLKQGAPRAPGMKYRHYSPKAKVMLYEAGSTYPDVGSMQKQGFNNVGFILTRHWKPQTSKSTMNGDHHAQEPSGVVNRFASLTSAAVSRPQVNQHTMGTLTASTIVLGDSSVDVARDLFWALRELDRKGCDLICVEGISDGEGDVAAAVMNRLRKAAEIQIAAS